LNGETWTLTRDLPEGNYSISANAADSNGYSTYTNWLSFSIDQEGRLSNLKVLDKNDLLKENKENFEQWVQDRMK